MGPLYHSVVSTCDLSSMAASWKLDFLPIVLELPRYTFQKGEQSRSCTTLHSPASEIMQHHSLCRHMPTQIQGGILEEGMTRSHCKKIMWIGDILCGHLWKMQSVTGKDRSSPSDLAVENILYWGSLFKGQCKAKRSLGITFHNHWRSLWVYRFVR